MSLTDAKGLPEIGEASGSSFWTTSLHWDQTDAQTALRVTGSPTSASELLWAPDKIPYGVQAPRCAIDLVTTPSNFFVSDIPSITELC